MWYKKLTFVLRRQNCKFMLGVAFFLLLCGACSMSRAGDAFAPMHHTAWTNRQGAPSGIQSLAQTNDGWLWIGSTVGLFRFDGTQFDRVEAIGGKSLLSRNIVKLFADDDELWIGYQFGGISVIKGSRIVHFTQSDGLPAGSVANIVKTPDGIMWAATGEGLFYLSNGRWHSGSTEFGLPSTMLVFMRLDSSGALWTKFDDALYTRDATTKAFRKVLSLPGFRNLDVRADGSVWLTSEAGEVLKYTPKNHSLEKINIPDGLHGQIGLDFDASGNAWIDRAGMLERVSLESPVTVEQQFTRAQGFSGEFTQCILEDREGNFWVGTNGGLDRFRRNRLTQVDLAADLYFPGIFAGHAGSVWIGGREDVPAINAVGSVRKSWPSIKGVEAAYRAPDGAMWFGSKHAVSRQIDSESVSWPLPAVMPQMGVQAMTMDSAGKLWVSIVHHGLYTLDNGKWIKDGGRSDIPGDTATTLLTDHEGRMWIGYTQGRIGVLAKDKFTMFDQTNGLQTGTVLSIQAKNEELWIGGEDGLAHFVNGKFLNIKGSDGQNFHGISGIVLRKNGDIWLHGSDGISRISADELGRIRGLEGAAVSYERYNFQDGLNGVAPQIRPIPSLIEDDDGKIWYATSGSVGWIDPDHIFRNNLTPPVSIRSLVTDKDKYIPSSDLLLPENTTNLRIDFTALALSIPERVRFLYKLSGVDQEWRDPGERRSAFYTRLSPGKYTFQVKAANEDGVWNETGAKANFEIAATFTQGPWFKAICLFGLIFLLYLLYLWRISWITSRIKERLNERLMERERIARSLHDTLLQGVHSLTLKVQTASNSLPNEMPARIELERALDSADQIIEDGRDEVMALRSTSEIYCNLPEALKDVGVMLSHQYHVEFSLTVEGKERETEALVNDDIYNIAREAMLNAFRHSEAKTIKLILTYNEAYLQVQIFDDGNGIDDSTRSAGYRPGHWGLQGMNERASDIDGTFEIWSSAGNGTEVRLTVPGWRAYCNYKGNFLSRWIEILMVRRRATRQLKINQKRK